jgi:hypothetical protein
MLRRVRGILGTALTWAAGWSLVGPPCAMAQDVAQIIPAVHPLGPRLAITVELLRSVGSIRALSDGRVLVDNPEQRQVFLFDSTLSARRAVLDSSGSEIAGVGLGAVPSKLVAFSGDSTMYLDPRSLAVLILDPNGQLVRVVAPAQPRDLSLMVGGGSGWNGRDAIVYLGRRDRPVAPPATGADGQPIRLATVFDSLPLLRGSDARRSTDTVGFVRSSHPPPPLDQVVAPDGSRPVMPHVIDPLPLADGWVVLASGTVAILRAQTFQLELIRPDGTRRTVTIAHEWRRLTDSAKAALVDSAQEWADAHPATGTHAGPPGSGMVRFSVPNQILSVDQLRDYRAPFKPPVYGDAASHVWIRETEPQNVGGALGTVYDIVDTVGRIIDRIDIPGGTNIVGFGPGTVYLTSREGLGVVLAKYRIH